MAPNVKRSSKQTVYYENPQRPTVVSQGLLKDDAGVSPRRTTTTQKKAKQVSSERTVEVEKPASLGAGPSGMALDSARKLTMQQ